MDIQFECACGESLSTFTRGEDGVETSYECPGCSTVYLVTITPISGPQT
ncbi:MAG: hypothetical protein ABEH64_13230 [Salinirussus sp.]